MLQWEQDEVEVVVLLLQSGALKGVINRGGKLHFYILSIFLFLHPPNNLPKVLFFACK